MAFSSETLTSQTTLLLALPRAGSCLCVTVHGGRGLQQYILELDDVTDGGGWVKVGGWEAEGGQAAHAAVTAQGIPCPITCVLSWVSVPCTCRGVAWVSMTWLTAYTEAGVSLVQPVSPTTAAAAAAPPELLLTVPCAWRPSADPGAEQQCDHDEPDLRYQRHLPVLRQPGHAQVGEGGGQQAMTWPQVHVFAESGGIGPT